MIGRVNAGQFEPPGLAGLASGSGRAGANKAASRAQLRVQSALLRRIDARDPAVAEEAAAKLVSELFFAPMLAEMRKFPFGRDLAVGGRTEAIFGSQLDERVADAVAANSPGLTKQLVRDLQPPGSDRAQWRQNPATRSAARLAEGDS